MIIMTLEEQLLSIKEQVRQALITALAGKQDVKARKLFAILNDISGLIPYRPGSSSFSVSSSPDVISFGGADAGIVSE